LGELTKALHRSLTEAADTVGQGSRYAAGIREYRRASKTAAAAKKAAKYGGAAVGAGAIGNYVLDKIVDTMAQPQRRSR
jgi:hypothetical protein